MKKDNVTQLNAERESLKEKRDFGNGWFGTHVEDVETTQTVVLGKGFVPPIGVKAAYDNWTQQGQYNDDFFAMFPELKVENRRIVEDEMVDLDCHHVQGEYEITLHIKRAVYDMEYHAPQVANLAEIAGAMAGDESVGTVIKR